MPQAPSEVQVHTVGVKHDHADGVLPPTEAERSRSVPPPPHQRVHDPERDKEQL